MRLSALFLLLLAAPPVFAQTAERAFDPETGEPVPLGGARPPNPVAPESGGGGTMLIQHLVEGSTSIVRTSGADVFFQNGAALVYATVATVGGGAEIVEEGRYVLPALPDDMALDGDLAYLALGKGKGLHILNVSTPSDIQFLGAAEGDDLFAVAASGSYVYAGRGFDGLIVYDITDWGNPRVVATLDTPGSANGTWVDGDLLCVADGNNASGPDFRLYDLTNPALPSLLGTLEAGGFVTYCVLDGDVAYLTGAFGLMTVDVSDPANPVTLDTYPAGGDTTYEIALDGTTAYVAGLAGLFAVDVSDPADLAEIGAFTDSGQGLGVAAYAGATQAFLADRFEGLRLVDFGASGTAEEVAFYENGGFSHKPFFDGDFLYVTELAGTLRIIDVSGLLGGGGSAVEVGRIDVPPNTQEVLVRDGLAYVTDADFGGTGLTIVDVSVPAMPRIVGGYGTANQAFGLDLVGTTLFLANGFSGLVALDVSDPANVQALGSFPMGSNTVDVVVDEDVAYVVNFGAGMYSLDVSDPAAITQLDAETDWGFLNALAFELPVFSSNRWLYVADGQQGLRVVDASNPADLMTKLTVPVQTQARDVAAGIGIFGDSGGPVTYVADDFFGLQTFIGDFPIGTFASADRGIGAAAHVLFGARADLVALAAGEGGIYLFEGPFAVANEPSALPQAVALEPVRPNPLHDAGTVRYTLAEAGPATLALYDLLGRRVAVLADGVQAIGTHEARVEVGSLPGGVYVLRLQSGRHVASAKLAVVR